MDKASKKAEVFAVFFNAMLLQITKCMWCHLFWSVSAYSVISSRVLCMPPDHCGTVFQHTKTDKAEVIAGRITLFMQTVLTKNHLFQ